MLLWSVGLPLVSIISVSLGFLLSFVLNFWLSYHARNDASSELGVYIGNMKHISVPNDDYTITTYLRFSWAMVLESGPNTFFVYLSSENN